MITPRPSVLARIFDELVRNSRRSGRVCRSPLKGGAELVVLATGGTITATIKRSKVKVGATELVTFKQHCRVPLDAELLTPPDQGMRMVATPTDDPAFGSLTVDVPWFYVTLRWKEDQS